MILAPATTALYKFLICERFNAVSLTRRRGLLSLRVTFAALETS